MAKKLKNEVKIDTIDESVCTDVLCVISRGLTDGLGRPEPGGMCVEAAVNYSLGHGHDDRPLCVNGALAQLKISINDANFWKSDVARAIGLRRIAIAQLGTGKGYNFDYKVFTKLFVKWYNKTIVSRYKTNWSDKAEKFNKQLAAVLKTKVKTENDFHKMQTKIDSISYEMERFHSDGEGDRGEVALLSSSKLTFNEIFTTLPHDIEYEQKLWIEIIEGMVQVLKKMKTKGSKYLYLTEKKLDSRTVKRRLARLAKERKEREELEHDDF